jgi:hypothetical protein
MSAILVLKMISDEQISTLLAIPIQERLEQYFSENFVTSEERTDTDVAWQALHFLLTGTLQAGDPPASSLLVGGTIIGPSVLSPSRDTITSGLGEVDRFLTSQEVDEFNEYLSTITDEEFRKRFTMRYSSMGEVYPEIWQGDPERDVADLLLSFHAVKTFINEASKREKALLLHFA